MSMPLPLVGGCQCGACRYVVTEPPLTLYVRHCTEGRHQSGSAFGISRRAHGMQIPLSGAGKPTTQARKRMGTCGKYGTALAAPPTGGG